MPELLIGIDPDVSLSGYATWSPSTKQLQLFQYDLFELTNQLIRVHAIYKIKIYLEAGWKLKGNWHKGGSKFSGKQVGANHEIGRQIEKFSIKHKIPYQLIIPAGYSSVDHERFCMITGWPKNVKTNSEKRVAGLIVYGR